MANRDSRGRFTGSGGTSYAVQTRYELDTSPAESALGRLTATLEGAGRQFSAFGSFTRGVFLGLGVEAARHAIGGIASVSHALIGMQSHLETTRLSIAGNLQAFQLFGRNDFAGAAAATSEILDRIRVDAAALPGEAEDFVRAFQYGLPAALESGVRNLNVIESMTSRFTAAMLGEQISAEQSASDFARILTGHAGAAVISFRPLHTHIAAVSREIANATSIAADSPLFAGLRGTPEGEREIQRLIPILRTLRGQVVEDTHAWNGLTNTQRTALFQAALSRFQPMIERMGETWEAQAGTFESYKTRMVQLFTAPVFELFRSRLTALNGWLTAHSSAFEGWATRAGNVVRDQLGGALDHATSLVVRLGERMAGLGGSAAGLWGSVQGFGGSLAGAAGRLGPGGLMGLLGLGSGGFGGLIGAGATAMLTEHADVLGSALRTLGRMVEDAVPAVEAIGSVMSDAGRVIASVVSSALPGFMSGLESAWHGAVGAIAPVTNAMHGLLDALAGPLQQLGTLLGGVAEALGPIAGELLQSFGSALSEATHQLSNSILTIQDWSRSLESWIADAARGTSGLINQMFAGPGGGAAGQSAGGPRQLWEQFHAADLAAGNWVTAFGHTVSDIFSHSLALFSPTRSARAEMGTDILMGRMEHAIRAGGLGTLSAGDRQGLQGLSQSNWQTLAARAGADPAVLLGELMRQSKAAGEDTSALVSTLRALGGTLSREQGDTTKDSEERAWRQRMLEYDAQMVDLLTQQSQHYFRSDMGWQSTTTLSPGQETGIDHAALARFGRRGRTAPEDHQARHAARRGHTRVQVTIINEINQANDPDRVLIDTSRALSMALGAHIESPSHRGLPRGGLRP